MNPITLYFFIIFETFPNFISKWLLYHTYPAFWCDKFDLMVWKNSSQLKWNYDVHTSSENLHLDIMGGCILGFLIDLTKYWIKIDFSKMLKIFTQNENCVCLFIPEKTRNRNV